MSYKQLFGDFFKEKRLQHKLSLRKFCSKHNFDPGNISKIERGLLAPSPSVDILEKYALALNLKKNSDEWIEFMDRAKACRGEIPQEILQNEEVVKKLPLFFRTLRGEKLSEEKLEEIINIIQKGGS